MTSPSILKIREFDPDLILPNDYEDRKQTGMKITVIGKPGTGKTSLISYLLYMKQHIIPVGMVMCGTEDSQGHYKKIFPSLFVYNRLDENALVSFIKRQKVAIQYLPENPWSLLLLDDCTDDPKILNTKVFHGLYKNGRQWKMLFILSLQYCMDIRPAIRTNIDGVFILRETNLKNRRSLWENYAGVIPDFNLFCEIMDTLTEDYQAVYIHNRTNSNKLEDCVFWWKTPPLEEYIDDFKFGSNDYWNFHKARFNTEYRDPIV